MPNANTKHTLEIKELFKSNLVVLMVVIVVLSVALTFLTPHFLTLNNIRNIAQQTTIFGMLGIGMTFVVLTGGIDISVGSTLAFSGVMYAIFLHAGVPFPLALVLCILVGSICGAFNGMLVTVAKVPPFIATMGTLGIIRGMALVVTQARAITGFGNDVRFIGAGVIADLVPFSFILLMVGMVVAYFVLEHTKTGRFIYVLGGNADAARLSGVKVNKYKFIAYVVCGATAAVAGIIMVGRLNSAIPIAADGDELDAIAAVVLGGTSMNGGVGRVWGTFLGALTMTIVRNGMNLLNVHTHFQRIVIGVIIIAAVMVDTLRRSK